MNSYRANVEMVRPGLFGDAPPGRDGSLTPRISGLQPDLTNLNVTFVKVGEKVVAKVPFADIEKLGLRVGASWTTRLSQTCDQAFSVMQAKEHATKLLAIKGKSAVQLEAKLVEKGFTSVVVKTAVEELKKSGVINDALVAEQVVGVEVTRHTSVTFVRKKLAEVGIDEETATATIKRATKGKSEAARAKAAAEELSDKIVGKVAKATRWRKVYQGLIRKGFDEDVARMATRKVEGAEPE
ncbi:MAG: RecX family transcriptional regulator [Phycisphaerales bacterium]